MVKRKYLHQHPKKLPELSLQNRTTSQSGNPLKGTTK
jgi:hypothetical protein